MNQQEDVRWSNKCVNFQPRWSNRNQIYFLPEIKKKKDIRNTLNNYRDIECQEIKNSDLWETESKQTESYNGSSFRPNENFQAMVQGQGNQLGLLVSEFSRWSWNSRMQWNSQRKVMKMRDCQRENCGDPQWILLRSSALYWSANSLIEINLGQGKSPKDLEKSIPRNYRGPEIVCVPNSQSGKTHNLQNLG